MARSLRFERTGNEFAIVGVFGFICCLLGTIIQVLLGEGFNFVVLGAGCFILVLGLASHKQLRNKKERAEKQEH